MNDQALIPWPEMPAHPGVFEYFWHQLPWAMPGLLTFLTGMVLASAGFYAAARKGRRAFYISFALTCLAFGMLGLTLALRAVIADKAVLLRLNRLLYVMVLIQSPMTAHLLDYITERTYLIMRLTAYVLWGTVLYGLYGLYIGQAFSGEWHHFAFGLYPRAGSYLKPWAVAGLIAYAFAAIPACVLYLRKRGARSRLPLIIGVNFLAASVMSNAPSFLGYSFFPGANFAFVPMAFLAYGVFRRDFLNLNDLLFNKSGLFYGLNAVLGGTFLLLALLPAYGLTPASYGDVAWETQALLPLLSAAAVFGLGILLGGTNPRNRINQMGAFSLYIVGFLLITVAVHNIGLPPIVVRRIEQFCYMIFALVPSVQLRFAFMALRRNPPRYVYFFDVAAIICSASAMTPWLYPHGYYEYSFGQISAAGPMLLVLGLVGGGAVFVATLEWWRNRGKGRMGDLVTLYVVMGGLLMLLYIPPTLGYGIYPLGNLIVLPTLILAYAVLKYGGRTIHTHALRISHRLSLFVLIITPVFLLLYYPSLRGLAPEGDVFFHLLLIAVPLLLLCYQFTFLFSRAVSQQLDDIYARMQSEKAEAERAREQVEKLNDFSRQMNSTSNLDVILEGIFAYIAVNFRIGGIWLLMVDRKRNELYTYKVTAGASIPRSLLYYLNDFRAPLSPRTGTLYQVWKRKRPFYQRRVRSGLEDTVDSELQERLRLRSFFQIPLVIQDQTTAIICFTRYNEQMLLKREDQATIARFCEQIAGAIHGSHLYKKAEELRFVAEESARTIEKQRAELEKEILLAKRIQETLLPEIPELPEVRMAFKYTPMLSVGGDFVDVLHVPGRLGFFICDVSGHGVPAAFLSSMIKMSLSGWATMLDQPAKILRRIQATLAGKMAQHYISACIGCIDLEQGRVVTANAGHPPLLRLKANGELDIVDEKSRIILDYDLGRLDAVDYEFTIEAGDRLILHTDGIPEASNRKGEILGEDAFYEMARGYRDQSPDAFCEKTYADILAYRGGAQLEDDFTLFVIDFLGAAKTIKA